MRYFLLILMCLSLVGVMSLYGTATSEAGDGHPFNVRDLVTLKRLSGHSVSPDGKQVVFVLRTTDMDANKGRTDLWIMDVDGRNLKQLVKDKAGDFEPVWAKDGKTIYFLSTRSKSSQIWSIAPTGGEAKQVSKLPLDVSNLNLSNDGTKFAFSMEVFPGKSPKETNVEMEVKKKSKTSGMIYDNLMFRHWDHWEDGRRYHVFVMPVAGGEPVDVMKMMDTDSPTKPWGDSGEFTFSPDDKHIVFTIHNGGKQQAYSTNYDLFQAPADASAAPKCLTTSKAWDTAPQFSPDGKTLAYLAMERPGFEADRYRLILRSWADGTERVLTQDWDRSVGSFKWGPKSKKIYVTAGNLGQRSLFEIDVKKSTVKTIVRDGRVTGFDFAGKKIIYGLTTLKSPTELFSVDFKGKKSAQLTHVNKDQLAGLKMGDYEQFTFKGWNDEIVHAYMVKPVDFDPAKKYPVAFLIHGGPQGSFGNSFHYRWNPQTYTGAGYAAVMVDFHGSTGYGQAFTDSISKDWGGKPFIDLQKGLAAALAKYPWMDGKRVGALGASYGGYMINWIAGNWPDRFNCLVNHDGNLDEQMAYYDTEELWFPEWEHGGTPWENPEGYQKHNPINYVKNWKTPMLVVHGALDYRVVDVQGMSTFTALQRKGVPSKFLYFPDENHWVLKPHNSILWHDTVLDWMDQWCKKK